MKSTSSVEDILPTTNSQLAIGKNKYKPIGNSQLERVKPATVDMLLDTYSDLIVDDYKLWFAKRFYKMTPTTVARCASEAKADTNGDPRRLFAFLINKASA